MSSIASAEGLSRKAWVEDMSGGLVLPPTQPQESHHLTPSPLPHIGRGLQAASRGRGVRVEASACDARRARSPALRIHPGDPQPALAGADLPPVTCFTLLTGPRLVLHFLCLTFRTTFRKVGHMVPKDRQRFMGCLRRAARPIPASTPPPERIGPTGPALPAGRSSDRRPGDRPRRPRAGRTTKAGFETTQRSP